MQKDYKDLIDEQKIAELATSPNAQEAFFGRDGLSSTTLLSID